MSSDKPQHPETTQQHNPNKKVFPPSRFVVDDDNNKWRLCAGCAVLNSDNHILVGERIHIANAWQTPQGGVDDAWPENNFQAESIFEAACRELYEEMGLIHNKHVVPIETAQMEPCRYKTQGTNSWLTKSGFAGQELHWCVFRCIDGRGDADPTTVCDLSGKNGEEAEFAQVKWAPIDWAVDNMWPAKRSPYESLRRALTPICKAWKLQCSKLDFTGKWSRVSGQYTGVVDALMDETFSREYAKVEANNTRLEIWSRDSTDDTSWNVKTLHADGKTVLGEVVYRMGSWQEEFPDSAVVLGDYDQSNDTGTVQCRTALVAEPDGGIAHSTIFETPPGAEESRRYLNKDGCLVSRRTLWPTDTTEPTTVITDVFVKTDNEE